MESIVIIPENVCADRILVTMDGGVIDGVEFQGGCNGNSKALARLLRGMRAERAAALLAGVDCDGKGTSCADQLAKGLRDGMAGTTAESNDASNALRADD